MAKKKQLKASPKRSALGDNPLDTLVRPAPAKPPSAPAPRAKRVRAQLNVLFDSWEWLDFLAAATDVATYRDRQARLQRDVLIQALKLWEQTLAPDELAMLREKIAERRRLRPRGE